MLRQISDNEQLHVLLDNGLDRRYLGYLLSEGYCHTLLLLFVQRLNPHEGHR